VLLPLLFFVPIVIPNNVNINVGTTIGTKNNKGSNTPTTTTPQK
jgi:hypothetical protein